MYPPLSVTAQQVLTIVLTVTLGLTLPTYLALAKIYGRIRTEDVDANERRVAENKEIARTLEQRLDRIEREMELVKNDIHVIHDLIADENHCGSRQCRWCDRDTDTDTHRR